MSPHNFASQQDSIPSRSQEETFPFAGQSLLVVDDNQLLRERLAEAFRRRKLEVRTACNYEEAIRLAQEDSPELAVIDLRMPGKSGLELLRDLLKIDPSTRVVMVTGFGSIATAVEAMRYGAANYVSKPADADDVLAAFVREKTPEPEAPMPNYETPTLARAEWEHINRVLSDCGGNISEAARRLGIHRRSLQRKLQKLAPQ
ncbi:Photosynthetic apparatus regulatory protein RegA [Planctomycetales bacterium 10988]|nr:Photosynthetic apparatus regulatory protein RegA [Planctomycetales bacterium 10988]